MRYNRSGIPKFGESEHSFILSKNARPSNPPFISKATILPQLSCFGQFHIADAISKGIFHLPWLLL
jgi:hypothetical protein